MLLPLASKDPRGVAREKCRRAASREDGGRKSRRRKWKWVRVGTGGGVLRLSPQLLGLVWCESLGWGFVCSVRERAPSFKLRPG